MSKSVVITGATGFVGRRLCIALFKKGYQLTILCRSPEKAKLLIPLPATFVKWDAESELSEKHLEGAVGILHLAGSPIADGRWTQKRKAEIVASRTRSSANLVAAAKRCQNPPQVLVGASGVGVYGDRGDEPLTEDSTSGQGFLADVCRDWEAAQALFPGRAVMLRTGVVLGHGGALRKMLPAFRLGAGGRLSHGHQWMSWIHVEDLVGLYIYALENESLQEPVNAIAPGHVTNRQFTAELSKAVAVPAIVPVPGFMLKLIFGEMSSVLLDSQRVVPQRALAAGFKFQFPELGAALGSILRARGHVGGHVFESYQWLPKNKPEMFEFFSKAENLETITPPWLNFRIVKKSHAEIQEGMLIDYRLKIKGVPASWRTRISQWSPPHQFMDSQLKGPYSLWDHIHRFEELNGGTLMTDEVVYRVPLGPIGHIVNELVIRNDVETIFNYRTKKMASYFSDGASGAPRALP
jgi:uncharacterized protein (TIGR01777 family)